LILHSLFVGAITSLVVNELVAGFQSYRLVSKRGKLLKQDLDYLNNYPRSEVVWSDFLAHMNRQEKEHPELFIVPFVPPTFFFKDEREKYLESLTWIREGKPKHLIMKQKLKEMRGKS
jgi:hypothetical protein